MDRKERARPKHGGFFGPLLRDTRANVMLIGAASIIPLVGLIGGAVDMSRAYLVKTRLQQACDAGTLAARKEMAGTVAANGGVPEKALAIGNQFFDANFIDGTHGSYNRMFAIDAGSDTRLDGTASVDLPLTLMTVFGLTETDIAVACSAELNLPNIDVVLVLDQSGSMNASRMDALRQAVFAFYDQVHQVKPENARIRIGVVPYSGAVRVGALLRAKDPDFLADSWTYQSREPVFRRMLPPNLDNMYSTDMNHFKWSWSSSNRNNCNNYNNRTFNHGGTVYTVSNAALFNRYFGTSGSTAACLANIVKSGPLESASESRWRGTLYLHKAETFNTSQFKRGVEVTTSTGDHGEDVQSVWNDCIEERATVAATSFSPIPAGALDLDIRLIPAKARPETQWKPMWPQITYTRPGAAEVLTIDEPERGFNCPSPARKLAEYPLAGTARNVDFQSYINGLVPTGGTMHDIGMIWAGRFISTAGIFGDENEIAPNGNPISRHIVFMTDGEMGASPQNTTSYGNYDMDGRFAGFKSGGWGEAQLAAIHNARLAAICDRIKNDNVTIWSITFGLEQNQYTRGCASGNARAFEATDAPTLAQRFRQIAGAIAELRLVE